MRYVKGTEYAAEGMVEFLDDDTVLTLSGDEYKERRFSILSTPSSPTMDFNMDGLWTRMRRSSAVNGRAPSPRSEPAGI